MIAREEDDGMTHEFDRIEHDLRARRPGALEEAMRTCQGYRGQAAMMASKAAHVDRLVETALYLSERSLRQRDCDALHAARCLAQADKIEGLLAAYGNTPRQDDDGPTYETARRERATDGCLALFRRAQITHGQYQAALDIARIYHEVVRALMARTSRMTAAGRPPRRSGVTELPIDLDIALRHHHVYLPWAKAVQDHSIDTDARKADALPLPMVIDIVIDGRALNTVAGENRMGHERALRLFGATLSDYADRLDRYDVRRKVPHAPGARSDGGPPSGSPPLPRRAQRRA